MLDDLRDTVEAANYEIERLDRLVSTAESVTGTVDSASRLAYIAMANPVIKGVAFASGTAKAARRLRGRKADGLSRRAPRARDAEADVLVHHRRHGRASAGRCGSGARCCAPCGATRPSRCRPT